MWKRQSRPGKFHFTCYQSFWYVIWLFQSCAAYPCITSSLSSHFHDILLSLASKVLLAQSHCGSICVRQSMFRGLVTALVILFVRRTKVQEDMKGIMSYLPCKTTFAALCPLNNSFYILPAIVLNYVKFSYKMRLPYKTVWNKSSQYYMEWA